MSTTTVLLTGGSSFTGLWFAERLAKAGYHVVAPLQRAVGDYAGAYGVRVRRLTTIAEIIERCSFGSDALLALISDREFSVLCHHAARVTNHKSLDFDVMDALHNNTHNLQNILARAKGLRGVILTGSVFEADELGKGLSSEAFSPYGLSKTLTSAVFRYWCGHFNIPLTRFIIPYPYGPLEGTNFCARMMESWARNNAVIVPSPHTLSDNTPVLPLATAYADCVGKILAGAAPSHLAPSGYLESRGAFAQRMAQEMSARLGWRCAVELSLQQDPVESVSRINAGKIGATQLVWDEEKAWDDLADYYRTIYA